MQQDFITPITKSLHFLTRVVLKNEKTIDNVKYLCSSLRRYSESVSLEGGNNLQATEDKRAAKTVDNASVKKRVYNSQIRGGGIDTRRREGITLKAKLNGATNTEALTAAGYAPSVVRSQAPMRRINGELCAALERQGLTADALAGHIIAGLNATSPLIRKGEIVKDSEGTPDYRARAQYARITVDVCGDVAPRKHELSGSATLDVSVKREEATAVWGKLGTDE